MIQQDLNTLMELASAVCDDRASQDEIEQLEILLKGNAQAQAAYADYMLLHAELYWQQESLQDQNGTKIRVTSYGSNPLGWTTLWTLAAMLLVGSVLGAVIMWGMGSSGEQPIIRSVANWEHGESVAIVSQTVNCRWSLNQDNSDSVIVPIGYGSDCLLYTSPSPRDRQKSRMPSSA